MNQDHLLIGITKNGYKTDIKSSMKGNLLSQKIEIFIILIIFFIYIYNFYGDVWYDQVQ